MQRAFLPLLMFGVLTIGCAQEQNAATDDAGVDQASATEASSDANPVADEAAATTEPATDTSAPAATDAAADEAKGEATASAASKEVALTAENTKIQFACAHVGEKPDPNLRKGSFGKLTGTAVVEENTLKSLKAEIETESLTTDIDKLTNHLKSPDFFNVREHPKVTFQSTSVEPEEAGKVKITGDLTLLGKTESISFPATVSFDDGLALKAEFEIDRTKFGMDYGTDKVEKVVEMTITVGK